MAVKDSVGHATRPLVFDARWRGDFGIARYSHELRRRIRRPVIDVTADCNALSVKGILGWERATHAARAGASRSFLLSPSFTPSLTWGSRQAITVHDLIHLHVSDESDRLKRLYYEHVVRPSVRRNPVTFTVSEFSKAQLVDWAGVDADRVVVTGNAASPEFVPQGAVHNPGYPYVLYVRNAKPHKNTPGLIRAFARLDHPDLRLVLSGRPDESSVKAARSAGVIDRVVFAGRILGDELPAYYRGALVAAFPSFYEGFGIPPIEAMACGTVVVSSNRTSLPEVVGDAALLVDPGDDESISVGLERALNDAELRATLRERGFARTKHYSWDTIAGTVLTTLSNL